MVRSIIEDNMVLNLMDVVITQGCTLQLGVIRLDQLNLRSLEVDRKATLLPSTKFLLRMLKVLEELSPLGNVA